MDQTRRVLKPHITDHDKTYFICRVCYTKEAAAAWVQRAMSGTVGPMAGPDIYCVMEEDVPESRVIVWKPKLEGSIEIQYQKSHTELVPDTISFDELKLRILRLMGINTLEATENLAPDDHKTYCLNF